MPSATNQAPAPNRRPRFPLGGLGLFGYSVCAPPVSSAAVGEAQRWATSHFMKNIVLALGFVLFVGCSTPNPNPKANYAAYEQLKCGMSREQVYELLGQPQSVQPQGDIAHCREATWGIPHDAHGRGHWTLTFAGDTVTKVKTGHAVISH
jgi:SmpA / OmlA family